MKNNIKRVLSVDMDYIMGPSIMLYNDLVGSPEFSGLPFWDKINELRGLDDFLKYDEGSLIFLVKLVAAKVKGIPSENIFFAKEHDMILEFLCGDDQKSPETFEIYNVDHHHDIFYSERQKEEVDRFDFACLANWVYYLGKNSKIEKYHWIKNKNSVLLNPADAGDLTFPVDFNMEREKLFSINYDYIFVCMSSEYFPAKFQQYFYMLKAIAEGYFDREMDVWKEDYCKDGKTRHVQQ